MSNARNLANLLSSTGAIPSANLTGALPAIDGGSLTGISSTATRIHAFNQHADGSLLWTHTEGNLETKDNNNEDIYLDVLIGSSDQLYSINSDGDLICTYT